MERKRLWDRWKRGLGLSVLAALLLVIAWGIPQAVGELLIEQRGVPEWLRVPLGLVWLVAMLTGCPLAFEWLARKSGLAPREEASQDGALLEGPRVATTPAGEGRVCRGSWG